MQKFATNGTTVAFQGFFGANSDAALRKAFPEATPVECATFEDVFSALKKGKAAYAFIPVENSTAGRVADIHHLLPGEDVHIVAEHFEPIHHQLMSVPGATIETIKEVHSHVQALGQCRSYIRKHGWDALVHVDTAGSAKDVAKQGDSTKAAIANALAAETYGLEILDKNIEDTEHNTTRFLLLAHEKPAVLPSQDDFVITSILFRLRSVPAALYKAIGGFATNGVNLTKLESYMTGEKFSVAQFYIDVEGHPDSVAMQHALAELQHFSTEVRVLGVYEASDFRKDAKS